MNRPIAALAVLAILALVGVVGLRLIEGPDRPAGPAATVQDGPGSHGDTELDLSDDSLARASGRTRIETTDMPQVVPHSRESGSTPAWTIQVVDSEDRGLLGVALTTVGRDGVHAIGLTDANGELQSDNTRLAGTRVEAGKTGFATGVRILPPEPGPTRIVLSKAGRIHGRVVRHDGTSPGAGVRVLATPAGEPWDAGYLTRARTHSSLRCLAHTDADGRYSIDDADPNGLYSILVGGNGVLGGPVYEVTPGDRSVPDIVVLELYGAVVRFIDELGDPIQAPVQPSKQPFERTRVEGRSAVRLGPASAPVHLLGVGGGELDSRHQRLLLFANRDHSAAPGSIGPVVFDTSFPGYADSTLRFLAERFTESVPVYELVHRRTSESFGSIDVVVQGPNGSGSFGGRVSRLGRLQLTPEGPPDANELVFDLLPHSAGVQRVDGVPSGRYRPRVTLPNGSFRWPGPESEVLLDVLPDRVAVLEVDGRSLGSILLEVQRKDGSPYREGLVISLGEGEPIHQPDGSVLVTGGGDDIVFRRGPYLIEGLMPKTYSLKVRKPLTVQPDFRPIVVQVEAAETHVLTMRMSGDR